MADNITLSTNIGSGAVLATDDIGGTHYQIVKLTYGALDSQTIAASGAGAVSAGVPRMTLASDDPAVALLGTIDTDTGVIAGDTTSIDGKITACNTGAVVLAAGTAEIGKLAAGVAEIGNVKNSGTFAVQAAIDELPAAAAASDNFANPTTTNIMSMNMVWDGATWDRLPGNSTDGLLVNLGTNNDVSGTVTANAGTGTFTVDATGQGDVPITLAGEAVVLGAGTAEIGKLAAGTATIGKLGANSGTDIGDVDVTSISAGTNLIGDVGLSGARTSGGTTIFRSIDLDESEEEIKATAGQVYWIHAMNLSASTLYLKLYNATAATVVVGTTTPVMTLPLATQGDTNGAGFTLSIPNGIAFGTAITAACTTGIADNDTGAPGANTCVVNLGYA
jgi:hypothetical protein